MLAALSGSGFAESLDRRPVRFVVAGEPVPCLSAAQQVRFHQGYEPADRDRHDMAQLRRVLGIATHF